MSQGYNPITIANHFIDLSPKGLTLMQLLELSYISHGFTLALLDSPLADEYAGAWEFGPVFSSIYHEFKFEKPGLIKKKAQIANMKTNSLEYFVSNFDMDEEEIMEFTYKRYGKLDVWKLIAITHAEGTPWYEAWEEGKHIRGFSIRNELIKKHYKNLIEKHRSESEKSDEKHLK